MNNCITFSTLPRSAFILLPCPILLYFLISFAVLPSPLLSFISLLKRTLIINGASYLALSFIPSFLSFFLSILSFLSILPSILFYCNNRNLESFGKSVASDSKKAFNVTPPCSSALEYTINNKYNK